MKTLLIIGAGEYGQLVKELAEILGYRKIDFLDDHSQVAIGRVDEFQKFENEYEEFVVAIGNPIIRRTIIEKLEKSFRLVSLVHPTAIISKTAQIEDGCVIECYVVINAGARVGKACLINAGSVINHNSSVRDFCQVDCNAVVAADAVVLQDTKVASCTVWNQKR